MHAKRRGNRTSPPRGGENGAGRGWGGSGRRREKQTQEAGAPTRLRVLLTNAIWQAAWACVPETEIYTGKGHLLKYL